ncbi:MAG: hypothetical protein ACOYMB_04095 [Patescibacteria group bacterium]
MKDKIEYPVNVSASHISNFSEITKNGSITRCFELELGGPYFAKKIFQQPKSKEQKKLVLYFEGAKQSIKSSDLNKHLSGKGYKIINDPHPSLLINAMDVLTKEILIELELPWFTSILLPTHEKDYMKVSDGTPCIFSIQRRSDGDRDFKLHAADMVFDNSCALLIEKK